MFVLVSAGIDFNTYKTIYSLIIGLPHISPFIVCVESVGANLLQEFFMKQS